MIKTDENQGGTDRKPNWVEVATLVVLTLTLIAGGILAWLAYKQNELTRASIEASSRPLLSAGFEGTWKAKAGEILDGGIAIANHGKSPTKAHIRATSTFSLTELATPPLSSKEDIQLVWPGKGIHAVINHEQALTEGQISDMKSGKGWIYRRVLITYENFSTAICTQLAVKADSNPGNPDHMIAQPVRLCADPKTNEAS